MKSKLPQRRCLVSGDVNSTESLIRFVVDPNGRIVPDIKGRLPGRGLWLTAKKDCVIRGLENHVFDRVTHTKVQIPADFITQIEISLLKCCCEILGLARRAGLVQSGYDRVREFLKSGSAKLVITARGSGLHGQKKLLSKAVDLPHIDWFSMEELSLAIGRKNVVHAALATGGLTERFHSEAQRLSGFREIGQ